ncbi:alpha-1,2-fucosyltransferase [bacterium]|nr:alpha-1,2-fucosyltransferase [bacterium]
MKSNLKIIRSDGGICSQIAFAALGKYYEDKGFQVKYDLTWFKENGMDLNGRFCRNYDIKKAFPDMDFEEASEEESKQAKKSKNYIGGYPEERIYCFAKYKELFKKYFNPTDINQDLNNEINNTNACAVHIRRGDLATARACYGHPPGVDYFAKAIKLILALCPDTKFYFFSDEPDWIKENLLTELGSINYKICDKNGSDKGYLDLYLISQCKFIIASQGSLGFFGKILSNKNPLLITHRTDDFMCENFENIIIMSTLYNIPEEEKQITKILTEKPIEEPNLIKTILKNIFSVEKDFSIPQKRVKTTTILGLKIKTVKEYKF